MNFLSEGASRLLLLVLLLCWAHPAAAEKRAALVIGNAAYTSVPRLANPVNDAAAIAESLSRLGFEVTHLDNLGVDAMRKALSAFENSAADSDWALVYYAGHGMELDGRNWLVPIDAALAKASDIADEAIPLDRVLERTRAAGSLRIVILDACRNNPFLPRMDMGPGKTRTVTYRGLARVEPQTGEVVFFAARDGSVAQDSGKQDSGKEEDGKGPRARDGRSHSPFAQAILSNLEKPGLELGLFFREVTSDVLEATSPATQEPFVYGVLPRRQFYFSAPGAPAPDNNRTQTAAIQKPQTAPAPRPAPSPRPAPRDERPSLAGSRWTGKILGQARFYLWFKDGGVVYYKSDLGQSNNGQWRQEGDKIFIDMNNHATNYEGKIKRDNVIEGVAHNIKGQTWTWAVEKQPN